MSNLLIETLKSGLDPTLAERLENDNILYNEAQSYLQKLLVNEQLLSTDSFTINTQDSGNQKTLTEEIAELDLALRQIDLNLAQATNNNRNLIVEVCHDLRNVSDKIEVRLETEIKAILHEIREKQILSAAGSYDKVDASITENNFILKNIDSVLDIMELPTLCKLCILQGNYQEALEISTLAKMLKIKFPQLKTFSKIQAQIKLELQFMVRGLIKLLNTNLKQSHILKIFQILNRPDLMLFGVDQESLHSAARTKALKIIYLNSRFKFITSEVASLKPLLKFKSITHLKRYIEVYREHLFNSLSIYFAIFGTAPLGLANEEDGVLINAYIINLAKPLVNEIRSHLSAQAENEKDDPIELRSQRDGIILQVIYLCKSLSKHGMDFESYVASALCRQEPALVAIEDWNHSMAKVRKFRA